MSGFKEIVYDILYAVFVDASIKIHALWKLASNKISKCWFCGCADAFHVCWNPYCHCSDSFVFYSVDEVTTRT